MISVGILMLLDIPQERGMSHADLYYPNEDRECQFPLFNFLKPFPAEYMVLTYFILFLSMYRPSPRISFQLSLIQVLWGLPWVYSFVSQRLHLLLLIGIYSFWIKHHGIIIRISMV